MSSKPPKEPTYPGGIDAVLTQMEGRRDAFTYAPGDDFPAADLELASLAGQRVTDPDDDPALAPPFHSAFQRKRHALRKELTGKSELCYLNALLIAHLRKREVPPHAAALFQRLWREQGAHLITALDARWLVSSVTTFGDHGTTVVQRSVGLALNVLFGTMKLYETERLYSGLPPDRAYSLDNRQRSPLAMEMDAYSLTSGGLDVNMLGRLWTEAEGDPVIAPLAHHLLDALLRDERTVFRRLRIMRQRQLRRDEADASTPGATAKAKPRENLAPVPARARALSATTLRWGTVSTIRAPLRQIARFAAHHLDLGATALHLYLDAPDPEAQAFLSRDPRLHVTPCDDAYWQATGKPRMEAHQLRQAHNATRALSQVADSLDWLGHIDVDEFLLSERAVAELLAEVPIQCAFARIAPAEALAKEDGFPEHYKLTHHHAGAAKSVLQDIYPTFGLHLYGGFLSHSSGKIFARTGLPDTRLGIHALKYRGEEATNRHRLEGIWLGHHHAPSWAHFQSHLGFRRTLGSYRPRSERREMGQANLIAFLLEQEGEDGLRALFDEVCADTATLRTRLEAHGMLLTRPLDPDAAVRRIFGDLP